MKTLQSCHPGARRLIYSIAAATLATVLFMGAVPNTAHAQPGPAFVTPGPGPGRDLRIERDPRGQVLIRNGRDPYRFVAEVPVGRHIERRDVLLDLLLHPVANAFVWGLGDIANAEMAAMLGLPVRTVVYGVEPGVVVYSSMPPGYAYAEGLPANVALVSSGPTGPVVVMPNVPPNAYMAYQTAPNGAIISECVVVPQMAVSMPVPSMPPVYAPPAPTSPAAAPAPGAASTVLYDASHNPIGVLITNPDGSQHFVPVGK
jgi:hypothetical protein